MSKTTQLSFSKNDSWRIEYIEGEITQDQKEDVELLLKHSESERKMVDSLLNLKAALKDGENIEIPDEGGYLRSLHKKIMNGVLEVHNKQRDYAHGFSPVGLKKSDSSKNI